MKPINLKFQGGVALIVFVLMLIGIGGILLVGYSERLLKQVELSKTEHNTRVLKEAKQSLLQYAYNYPVNTPGRGPGRFPCPDTNNSGSPNPSFNCISGTPIVGRFPWNDADLNFYDALDASGERLWYAVSQNFANTIPVINDVINFDTLGTISIFDQTGSIIYDGTVAGIAAIIIAPGPAISRDENDDGIYEYIQVRGTVAQRDDPRNYLDTINNFDNSVFLNSANTPPDGFILGPVREIDPASPVNNTIVVNDQMVVITAEEVIAMAEKATLQAYQTAINDYRARPGFDVYPWLDDYSTANLSVYDADVGTRLGRLPSIFGNYFDGSISGSIESEINLSILYDSVGWDETIAIVDVNFDGGGDLVTNSSHSPGVRTFYLWDGHATTPDINSPQDFVWELCTGTAGTGGGGTGFPEDDCNRKTDGTFKIPTDPLPTESDVWLEVKIITIDFNQPATPLTFNNADLKVSPLIYIPPTATTHAYVSADYNNDSAHLLLTNDIDRDFKTGFTVQDVGPGFGVADRIRVGIRYYPELPDWPLATQDNWHNSIQMAYSSGYQPGAASSCTAGTDCITVNNVGGIQNDKIAVLVLASDLNLLDDDDNAVPIPAAPGYLDELDDIFDTENDDGDDIFDARANNGTGNDKILVIR